ncbi:hypothetical protein Tco_0993237 [Tanacetum coccineum]|uniref:Uncharacterized protein n=1 Tax=Tanacetum coccineum TaxID=301880 RepID=A0ABQ5F4C6_9ASTR
MDKTTDLHQHLLRISSQKLDTASQITRDAVTTHLKTALQDLQTASESHEADECEQNNPSEQNDDTSPWGNNKRKEKGEDGPEWIIRSKFEDELANFMLEKKSHAKGIGDMLVQHHKELREQYSQILSTINKSETPKPEAPTFAITTRSGISTQDLPFPAPPRPTTDNFTEGETEDKGLRA